MEVEIEYLDKKKKIKAKKGSTIEEALAKAGIDRETVIVKKGKQIVPLKEKLEHDDRLKAIRVVSGG